MNYDTHNIETTKVASEEDSDWTEAEEKAETVIKELEETADRESGRATETANRMLQGIQTIKLYDHGRISIEHNLDEFTFYLIRGLQPKRVRFEEQTISF